MRSDMGKEQCNLDGCQTAKDVYSNFYRSLPEDRAGEMVERKFLEYQTNLDNLSYGCAELLCIPLLEIVSRK